MAFCGDIAAQTPKNTDVNEVLVLTDTDFNRSSYIVVSNNNVLTVSDIGIDKSTLVRKGGR